MKLLNKLQSLKKNGDFKNVLYSLSSYFVSPIVIIVTTPILLKTLGSSDYGIWVLINSLINVLGISNFGLGNAFIKLGSEYASDEDDPRFGQMFSVSFTLSVILAVVMNVLALALDTTLFPLFFGHSSLDSILPVIHLVGGVVGLRIINSVISGSYMAKQRYDINSKVNIAYNLITSILFTILAVLYKDIKMLVVFLFISSILLLIINAFIAKKVNSNIQYRIRFSKSVFVRIFKYGVFSWFQMIISALNNQADKIIIGALLGSHVLGYYSVCMQLAMKIHEIPAAASAFLFAKFSALYEGKKVKEIRKIYFRAFLFKSIFIIISSSIAVVFAYPILSVWIDPGFASEHAFLFRVLIISVAIGAFNVIPNYCLNGTNYIKLNTVLSMSTSIAIFSSIFVLTPYYGDLSTGMSRLIGIPLVIFSIVYVHRRILTIKSNKQGENKIHDILTETTHA